MNEFLKLEKLDTLLITFIMALIITMICSGEVAHPDKRIEDLANQIKTLIGMSNFIGLGITVFSIIRLEDD